MNEKRKEKPVAQPESRENVDDLTGTTRTHCPCWCVAEHGINVGEEDWLHEGEPLTVRTGVLARLCMSVDPRTGAVDGPYVLVGSIEYTLPEAATLGGSLIGMASWATRVSRCGAT